MTTMRIIAAALLCAALSLTACSKSSPNDPGNGNGNGNGEVHDAAFWTKEGWKRYDSSDFSGARLAFSNAHSKDSTYAPAWSGMGWVDIELGYTGGALNEFETAIFHDSVLVDPYYGAAYTWHTQAINFPNVARDRYEKAIEFGLAGLDRGGDAFVYSNIATVNAISLRVLLARSYYGLADYDEAHDIVDILDPNNDLEPSRQTYLQELLSAIEELEELLP